MWVGNWVEMMEWISVDSLVSEMVVLKVGMKVDEKGSWKVAAKENALVEH
jgi:hypothetical protein